MDNRHWLTPQAATLIGIVFTMTAGAAVKLTYDPIRADIDALQETVIAIKSDPRPKPETRVELEAIQKDITRISAQVDHLTEHLDRIHLFMFQNCTQPAPMKMPPRTP